MHTTSLPRILFVVDVHDWAYDLRAQQWQQLLKDAFQIDIIHLKDLKQNSLTPTGSAYFGKLVALSDQDGQAEESKHLFEEIQANRDSLYTNELSLDHRQYDGIVFFYHKALNDKRLRGLPIPRNKVAVCINNEKWVEDGPEKTLAEYFSGVKVIIACNSHIQEIFTQYHPRVLRASQAINETIFKTDREETIRGVRIGRKFVVGWSGDYNNEIKNVGMIRTACEQADVKLLISKNRSQGELNEWYNTLIDVVICASSTEGGPLMLLEAGACSRPVITTPVGLAREIIKDRETGLLIPHDNLDEMVKAITILSKDLEIRERLAKNLHSEVMSHWTYAARKEEIRNVLETICSNN